MLTYLLYPQRSYCVHTLNVVNIVLVFAIANSDVLQLECHTTT